MKKIITSLGLVLVIGIPSLGAFAAGTHHAKLVKRKTISALCPVMGTKIPDVKKAAGKSIYKGKTYYFCCLGCKPQFDKSPAKYAKKK